MKTGIQFGF